MLDGNDGRELLFVHGEYKPAKLVKKGNVTTGKKGYLASSFGSALEIHEDILAVLSVYNESSNDIYSASAISQGLEEKVSNDVNSKKIVEITFFG